MTFADHYGFRAGTCFPYRPWLLPENRESHLLEIPLAIMDGTLKGMNLSEQESFEAVKNCLQRCKLVGGVFTFLSHNYTLLQSGYMEFYKRVLNLLVGGGRFDWETPAPDCGERASSFLKAGMPPALTRVILVDNAAALRSVSALAAIVGWRKVEK